MSNDATIHDRFDVLDGARGLAAIAVVTCHMPNSWLTADGGYLAVDFFFVLSGYVLAHAYDKRFAAGMTVWEFARIRLARLYPLYALGFVAGLCVVVAIGLRVPSTAMTPGALFITTLAAAFFLPVPPVLGVTEAFPLNLPRWSLFLEITINLLWAAVWRRLSTPVLIAICIGGALALAVGARAFGSLDFGGEWGMLAPSFARVFWCFPAGLLTYRLVGNQARTLPAWASYGMLLALAAVLWLPISDSWRWLYDLTASIVVFPLLIAIGARAQSPTIAAPALSFLGTSSYAVYILHYPLIRPFLWAAGKVFPGHLFQHMWIVVIIFIATVVVGAWIADAIFDRPARRWFNANLVRLSLRWQNNPG